MAARSALFLIDIAVIATFSYWISLEIGAPDWLFIAPHAVFIVSLLIAVGFRMRDARRGAAVAAGAYGMMVLWGVGLLVYVSLVNSHDGVHLGAYAILLVLSAAAFMFLNIVSIRISAVTQASS